MNRSKSSAVDDAQESADLRTRPEESSDFLSGETITSDSGIHAGPSYIDRKTLSTQGNCIALAIVQTGNAELLAELIGGQHGE